MLNCTAKYRIILIVVLALPLVGQAQGIDSIEFSFIPKSIRFGVDLLGMGKSFAKDDLTQYELTADIKFNKLLIDFDYGIEERDRLFDDGLYNVQGSYYRIGADISLTKPEDKGSVIFFGLRYGKANFDNSLGYVVNDVFGENMRNFTVNGVKASWYELTGGTKVKIWKPLWLGFTCRFKFGMKYDESDVLIPHDVPGYGKADEKSYWGFNYYLFYNIPFNKGRQSKKVLK